MSARRPLFVVGEIGARPWNGRPLEDTLARARARARAQGERVPVYRLGDGCKIADAWPDGMIDLTYEGAKIA